MEHRHQVRALWGLLPAAYWAVLIPAAVVVLTSGEGIEVFLALLAAGIPVYLISANAIVHGCRTAGAPEDGLEKQASNVVPFPAGARTTPRGTLLAGTEIAGTRLRKLG